MKSDPMIESYLAEIDSYLTGRMTLSEKSEVITQIKNDILSEKDQNSEIPLVEILTRYGQPKMIAHRHLTLKGFVSHSPTKTSASLFKWLILGFLGLVALSFGFTAFVIYKFVPDFRIDGETVQFGSGQWGTGIEAGEVEDYVNLEGITQVEFSFTNGEVEVEWSEEHTQLHYSCDFMGSSEDPFSFVRDERAPSVLKAQGVPSVGVDCEIKIPSEMSLHLLGANGSIKLSPDPQKTYEIRTHILVGKVQNVPKSVDQSTLIDVKLQNGEIRFR